MAADTPEDTEMSSAHFMTLVFQARKYLFVAVDIFCPLVEIKTHACTKEWCTELSLPWRRHLLYTGSLRQWKPVSFELPSVIIAGWMKLIFFINATSFYFLTPCLLWVRILSHITISHSVHFQNDRIKKPIHNPFTQDFPDLCGY